MTKVKWFEIFTILVGAVAICQIQNTDAVLKVIAVGIGYLVLSKAFEAHGVYSGAKHYDEVGHHYHD